MNFFHIYFLILMEEMPIFSSEYIEKNLTFSNEHKKTYSGISEIPEENKHTYKPLNMSKKDENLSNSKALELRTDMSKSQCNHTKQVVVKSRNTKFVIALKRLVRKKRQFSSDRNNHLDSDLIRLKKFMSSRNMDFRDDLDNSENNTSKPAEENGETPEGSPQSSTEVNTPSEESPKNESSPETSANEVNSENNVGKESSNKNETKLISDMSSNSEEDISYEEIWGSMLGNNDEESNQKLSTIGKIKNLLASSGDYMTAVLLRLLKDRLSKFNVGKQFWEKVDKISNENHVDRGTAIQTLINKLHSIFGKKFHKMLINLLKQLAQSIKQNLGNLFFIG